MGRIAVFRAEIQMSLESSTKRASFTSLFPCYLLLLCFSISWSFPAATVISFHYLWLQVRFVRNVTSWREMKPGFYHGHVAYLDFSK